jgi:orotidine-5'-phosphate decarboxylase
VTARDRLIVALDLPGAEEARRMAARLRGHAGQMKVGSQLFTAEGPSLVRELAGDGWPVFLDLKFHDIPNTVASAVEAASALGVSLLTVHALGGPEMLQAAVEAARRAGERRPRVLAITVLTSHDQAGLARLGVAGTVEECVRRLALLAREAGADGAVASPREAAVVREACGPGFLIVTPGIRPAGAPKGDQARHAVPGVALAAGADYLVVGRPVLSAPDPASAAVAIVAAMEAALR